MKKSDFLILYERINELNQLFNFIYQDFEKQKELFKNKEILNHQQKLYKYLVKIFIDSPPKCFQTITNYVYINKDYSARELISDLYHLLNNNAPPNWPHFCYNFSMTPKNMEFFFKKTLQKMVQYIEPMYSKEVELGEHAKNKLCKQSTDLLNYIVHETNDHEFPNNKNFFQFEANMFIREPVYENIFK